MSTSLVTRGSGLSPKGLLGAVLAGGISAALFATAVLHAETLLVFLFYIAAVPLFVAGLGAGSVASFVAALAGLGTLASTLPLSQVAAYAVLDVLPVVVIVLLALRFRLGTDQQPYWYPEGYLLTAITLYPCLLFAAALLLSADQNNGLLGVTTAFFHASADGIKTQAGLPPDVADQFIPLLDILAKYVPAMLGTCWIFLMTLSLLVAHVALKGQGWTIRPTFGWLNLAIPAWVIGLTALSSLLGALAPAPFDYIGTNVAVMLGLPFFFVGLAVVHGWTKTTGRPMVWLIIFYTLISVLVWLLLAVALLGAVDHWAHFRRRFASGAKQP